MKNRMMLALVAMAATSLCGACKTTGVEQASQTVGSLAEIRTELGKVPARIDAVTETLGALTSGQGDMVEQFGAYSTALEDLQSLNARLDDLRSDMASQKEDYQQAWQERLAAISSEELRQKAEERREQTMASFTELSETVDQADAQYDTWITTAKDLQIYLESDLNPAGVESIADQAEKLGAEAPAIQEGVGSVLASLDQLIDALTATTAAQGESSTPGGP